MADVLCPSAQPDWPGARLIGVVGGTPETARVAYVERAVAVSDELLALAAPLQPTEVFRFTAPCASSGCSHFGEGRCRLASKVVQRLPDVGLGLPPCPIRRDCLWWRQEGAEACRRCPQVVTQDPLQNEAWQRAADPAVMP